MAVACGMRSASARVRRDFLLFHYGLDHRRVCMARVRSLMLVCDFTLLSAYAVFRRHVAGVRRAFTAVRRPAGTRDGYLPDSACSRRPLSASVSPVAREEPKPATQGLTKRWSELRKYSRGGQRTLCAPLFEMTSTL